MVKQGYKQTEVGLIPEEWDIKCAESFGDIITGSTPSTENARFWNGDTPWITPSDIQEARDIAKSERMITKEGLSAIRELPPSTLLVTCIASIGKNAVLTQKGACNQQINAIIPSNEYSVNYLYYLMEINKEYLLANSGITATRIVSKNDFAKLKFAVSTNKKEQEYIAKALSDVDNMISSLEKLIAKKKAIKQGAMQKLLTGKKRLPGFAGSWEDYIIGKMGDFYSGLSGKSKKDFDSGEAYYITFLNVLSNVKIDPSILASVDVRENESQNSVRKGDLFFNTSSETPEEVGMCAVLDEDLDNTYLNSFCFGFRLNDDSHNPLFLSYYLNSAIGRKIMSVLAQGATRYNLSKNNFAETVIQLPEKEEQNAIASILSDMDNEIEALEQKLAKTRQIKQGMMQQLLTGKIRLV